jgi:hypothetical protein
MKGRKISNGTITDIGHLRHVTCVQPEKFTACSSELCYPYLKGMAAQLLTSFPVTTLWPVSS